MAERRSQTLSSFWLVYLRDHAKWQTRVSHYCGISCAIIGIAAAVVTGIWWLAALGILVNYVIDWSAHFLIEGNRPAAFGHPIWSALSGLRMYLLWITGRLGPELRRAGIK